MSKNTVFEKLDTSDMHGRSKRGMVVTMGSQGVKFGLQTCSTIALGRLLSPSDFGLIAMVAVIINFIAMFKDAGLAQATVQREQIANEQISTLFWLNLAISGLLGLLVIACAPLVAWIYGDSRLILLTIALSLPIFLSGISLQHRALLQRNMRFWEGSLSEILGIATGLVVGVCCAYWGFGYWSLVWMQVANVLVTTVIVLNLVHWCPLRPSRGTGVRDMLKFGANLTGFQLVNYFARNADNFLIARYSGASDLGQYSMAYKFLTLPIAQLNAPIVQVLLPALSRARGEPIVFSQLYLYYVKRVAWLTIAPISLMTIFGEEAIVMLVGEPWRDAGEFFEILAYAAVFQPVANLNGVLYASTGRVRTQFRWGCFTATLVVAAFCLGIPHGVRGVAVAYAIVVNVILLPGWWVALRGTPVTLGRFFSTLMVPAAGGFLIILIGLYVDI